MLDLKLEYSFIAFLTIHLNTQGLKQIWRIYQAIQGNITRAPCAFHSCWNLSSSAIKHGNLDRHYLLYNISEDLHAS